jgi:hypothetical protein
MNDLDDWLNSLGFDSNSPALESAVVPVPSALTSPVLSIETAPQPQAESPVTNISPDDFNDILADNGFQEPTYEEAEEVDDEDANEDNDEDVGESRDLDAEEDTDWNNLESQEVIQQDLPINVQEVTWDVIPPDNQEALRAVQSVNEDDYPEHNPDEETVNVSVGDQSAEVPVIHESVSEDALEAFNAVEESQPALVPEPLIPPNSPTLLLNNATSRFSGTEWYNEIQKQRVILAGCGGIGSWTILQLARMNPAALFMYDDDTVEQANMSGQLYCQDDIGKAKVDAMADMIKSYTTMRNIYAIKDKFTRNSEAGDVMICGFDNMEARRIFFTAWNNRVMAKPEEERKKCLYLDGRLSIDTLQVFCITGDNDWAMAEYADKYLFTDAQAEETQCSLKQTTYLACMIGSMIVNLFTNWTANLLNPIIPYDLPFFTEYDAQNMIFKTIK